MVLKHAYVSHLLQLSLYLRDAHLDEHSWLVVAVCGEDLLLLCGNGCIPVDEDSLQQHNITLAPHSS